MQSDDEDDDKEADDVEHSTSSRKESADNKPKCSAIAQLSEYELKKEKNIARNKALLEEHGLAGGASKLLKATGSRKNDTKSSDKNKKSGSSGLATTEGGKDESLKEVEKQDCTDTQSRTPGSSLSDILPPSSFQPPLMVHEPQSTLSTAVVAGGQVLTTGSKGKCYGSTLFPESVPGGLPSATGNHSKDAGECQRPGWNLKQTSDIGVANTVAPGNGTVFGEGAVAGVKPRSSLSDYLPGRTSYRLFSCLNQVRRFMSMPTTMCPTEVDFWMKRHRKAGTPKEIDAAEFGPHLVAWWHSLQRDERIQSSASPASYKHNGLEDGIWEKLRKGGPNGLGLVVVALGWWVSAYSEESEPSASLLELLEDVTWVLGQLSTSTIGGEAMQDMPRGNRKAGGGGGSRSKHLHLDLSF
ncbi:hypothetical protein BKA70DRAFT_1234735 [Coprinopsis sp. MPI-PUGE-AT-0042]|nr:hypothetical protein BKA70DRAFT_1234735 [Coprinopsis sp. MPI-PUGE-AT-0042]